MKCKHLKIRTKNYQKYYYCSLFKKEIDLKNCRKCDKKEYRLKTHLKGYKTNESSTKYKVSRKRVITLKSTYKSVLERDKGECQLCYSQNKLELHHIMGRGRYLTNDIDNCIMLCNHCHHNIVHNENKKYRPILKEIIAQKKN